MKYMRYQWLFLIPSLVQAATIAADVSEVRPGPVAVIVTGAARYPNPRQAGVAWVSGEVGQTVEETFVDERTKAAA